MRCQIQENTGRLSALVYRDDSRQVIDLVTLAIAFGNVTFMRVRSPNGLWNALERHLRWF